MAEQQHDQTSLSPFLRQRDEQYTSFANPFKANRRGSSPTTSTTSTNDMADISAIQISSCGGPSFDEKEDSAMLQEEKANATVARLGSIPDIEEHSSTIDLEQQQDFEVTHESEYPAENARAITEIEEGTSVESVMLQQYLCRGESILNTTATAIGVPVITTKALQSQQQIEVENKDHETVGITDEGSNNHEGTQNVVRKSVPIADTKALPTTDAKADVGSTLPESPYDSASSGNSQEEEAKKRFDRFWDKVMMGDTATGIMSPSPKVLKRKGENWAILKERGGSRYLSPFFNKRLTLSVFTFFVSGTVLLVLLFVVGMKQDTSGAGALGMSTTSPMPSAPRSDTPSINPTMSNMPTGTPSTRPTASTSPSSVPSMSPSNSMSPSYATISPDYRFKVRLQWQKSYFWQEEKVERWWCLECVKCKEYGGGDGWEHGCISHGTGSEDKCSVGDTIWIRDCRTRGNHFNVLETLDSGFMLRIDSRDLCIQRKGPRWLMMQKCDRNNIDQQFVPWEDFDKFELRPLAHKGLNEREARCASQLHHPKQDELVSLRDCRLSRIYETRHWQVYGDYENSSTLNIFDDGSAGDLGA